MLQTKAITRIVSRYYEPLRIHLTGVHRFPPEKADDLLHEFLTRKVLEKDLLARADRRRGRFRTFLLGALDRFVISEFRREVAQKRGSGGAVPLHEVNELLLDRKCAYQAFDVAWAQAVVREAIARMSTRCVQVQRQDVWEIFNNRLLKPNMEGVPSLSYEELVARLDLSSPSKAYNLLVTAKRMFMRCLEDVVSEYVLNSREMQDEIAELYQILQNAHTE